MNWYAEVVYTDGTSERMTCTTRREARDYLRKVTRWPEVVSVTVGKVGA